MTLCQKMEINKLGVIAYSSKKLTDGQKAYSNSKREMLALVLSVEKYDKYFAVAGAKIYAYIDHIDILPFLTAPPACIICKMDKASIKTYYRSTISLGESKLR